METVLSKPQSALTDLIARKLCFAILNQLEQGSLEVIDGDERFRFGDPQSDLRAMVEVHDSRAYRRLLASGSIGSGEAYVEGWWSSPSLIDVTRLFVRNLPTLEKFEKRFTWLTTPVNKLLHLANSNTRRGSRANIAAHYDLGNDMYQLLLDPHMQYSSGIYPHDEASLEQAQEQKLKTICDSLELQPGDEVIEIGTGWGGLACYMAQNYGCRVTTTTLSQQQFDYARRRIEEQGLQDRVTLLLKDYRDLDGQYDKLVSVEMIEAVGYRFLPTYFSKLESLLKPSGKMLIQAITIADQQFDQYRKSVDFIQRYIFPGGCLPSISEMCRRLGENTSMTVTRLTDYGHHYAQTLTHWAERLKHNASVLSEMGYDIDFQRLWNFYFAYCEGGFREGSIGLVHFEAAKPGARVWSGSGYNS